MPELCAPVSRASGMVPSRLSSTTRRKCVNGAPSWIGSASFHRERSTMRSGDAQPACGAAVVRTTRTSPAPRQDCPAGRATARRTACRNQAARPAAYARATATAHRRAPRPRVACSRSRPTDTPPEVSTKSHPSAARRRAASVAGSSGAMPSGTGSPPAARTAAATRSCSTTRSARRSDVAESLDGTSSSPVARIATRGRLWTAGAAHADRREHADVRGAECVPRRITTCAGRVRPRHAVGCCAPRPDRRR